MWLSLFGRVGAIYPIRYFDFVMPGLVPGIHVFLNCHQDVDGRDIQRRRASRWCPAMTP
jgi:hypothetical protein